MPQLGTVTTNQGAADARQIDWRSAVWASLIAGAAMMMIEMPFMAIAGMGFWAPPRMMAAMVLGQGVLPPPATFSFGVTMTGMMIHVVLSIGYGFMLAWVISRRTLETGMAAIVGGVFGLVLYAINFYGFTALFPWFADARGWISIVSHLIFGAVLGGAYAALVGRKAEAGA